MRRSQSGRLAICAAALGLCLALAACGSGDDGAIALISKADFLHLGNAICVNGNKYIQKAAEQQFPRGDGKPSQADQVRFSTQTVIPNAQRQIAALKELIPPDRDEAAVETILTEAQNALDEAKRDPAVLTSESPGPFASVDKLANTYGLTACDLGTGMN